MAEILREGGESAPPPQAKHNNQGAGTERVKIQSLNMIFRIFYQYYKIVQFQLWLKLGLTKMFGFIL